MLRERKREEEQEQEWDYVSGPANCPSISRTASQKDLSPSSRYTVPSRYDTVLYCTFQVWSCAVLYLPGITLCCAVLYLTGITLCCTVPSRYYTVMFCNFQVLHCCTVHPGIVLFCILQVMYCIHSILWKRSIILLLLLCWCVALR